MRRAGGHGAPGVLFTMWGKTRLVVMVSVIAAIQAASLIPFKPIPILPGVTEVRPGMVLPVVFSILFGPPAAWGAAIGNTIGDLFGTLGPGTLFGFLGNFLYGYLPWRVSEAWRGSAPRYSSTGDWLAFALAAVGASAACAIVIGWGIHWLGLFHFVTTAGIILLNNLLVCLVLGPPLLVAIHPRVARMGLLYPELAGGAAGAESPSVGRRTVSRLLTVVSVSSSLAGIGAGYLAWVAGRPDAALTAAVVPFVLVTVVASLLA